MNLSFYGAAHEVTGSCFYLEACGKRILIDCGMEQGADQYENQQLPVNASQVDCVLLTHAHIDHSGNIPLIYAKGFTGDVYCTHATFDLCNIMLRDSAHIQMFEAEWKNRKAQRSGDAPFTPAYTLEDVSGVLEHFKTYEYNIIFNIAEGINARFIDAGHLLGSSSIEIWITEGGITKKVVFSGDIGNTDQPLINDPQYINEADFVVMESTYGDRVHGERPDYIKALTDILQETFDKGGNVIIPSFAVGRTQEILFFIRKIKEGNLVKGHGSFPVYVDSPLAVEATNIFNQDTLGYYDSEALTLLHAGINPISFPGLKTVVTSDESKKINEDNEIKVIISASGMCDAGRIRHHLKHNLWRSECTVLFVGYQAEGTLGRALLNGAKKVKLFGEEIGVRSKIIRLEGVSGHADKNGLIRWITSFKEKPEMVFIVHGQDTVCDSFAELLNKEYDFNTRAPFSGEQYDIAANMLIKEGISEPKHKESAVKQHKNAVFARLQAAGLRLLNVINAKQGLSNKDIAKFTDQIDSLCKKWEK